MWTMLPWTGRGASGYPQRECFFCRTTSIILPPYKQQDALHVAHQQSSVATSSTTSTFSTGTPTNWFCSSCHCYNVADQDGTPVEQYTRPMWDEAWNRDRSQLMRHTRPQTPSSARAPVVSSPTPRTNVSSTITTGNTGFRFCHTCQTNQVLTLNMLADYLPGEDDPEYQQKLKLLPEYEATIASRYPPVCSDCAPRVEERITERDQFARSWSLGKWLHLKKKASLTRIADSLDCASSSSTFKPEKTGQTSNIPATTAWRSTVGALSNVISPDNGSTPAMVTFALVNTSMWFAYIATALQADDMATTAEGLADQVKSEPISLLSAKLGLFALILLPMLIVKSARMDPLKRSIERARARQLRVEVKGLQLWRSTQNVIAALRLIVLLSTIWVEVVPSIRAGALEWIEATTRSGRVELLQLVVGSILISEVGLTAFAASQLRVQPPAPLQLVSRPIHANGRHPRMSNLDSDALLTSLSLDDQAARRTYASDRHEGEDKSVFRPLAEQNGTAPGLERDADGDAVMEDVAEYVARRASHSSEDDWEDGSTHIAAPPGSAWSRKWPVQGAAKQSGFASTWAPLASRPRAYNDFQLGPQRFWEPQNPTGLEDVFGRAVSLDDEPQRSDRDGKEAGASKWSKWLGFS